MEAEMDDQRLFKRFKKNNLVKLKENDGFFFGNLEDISMMGASISAEKDLTMNQKLILESYFFSAPLPVEVIRKENHNQTIIYGVVFSALTEQETEEIYNLITTEGNE